MKRYVKCYFVFVIMILFLGGLMWFVVPTKTFSAMENRYLNIWPKLTLEGIRSGDVQEQMTSAADDQFIWRDGWMKCATGLQKCLGIRDLNGVYFGKDEFYFEKILDSDIQKSRYINNIRYIEKMADVAQSKVSVLLVPTAGTVLKDKLPNHAVLYDAIKMEQEGKELLAAGEWIALRPRLEQNKNQSQLYFHTDHHWTTKGAYEGYCAYMEAMGERPNEYAWYKPDCKSKNFLGTLYSKAPTKIKSDELILPQNIPNCVIYRDKVKIDGIYDTSKLVEKDKYAVYFGGNFGMIKIDNKEKIEGKTLVIIKDSYANSLVPYLIPHYKQIVMLDLRYFNESVNSFLKAEKPDEILVLYEMSRFAKDQNLFKVMR